MPSPAPRRWFSFSLRRMMVAFALLSVLFAGGRWWYVRIYHQDLTAWELQQLDCHVEYASLSGNQIPFDLRRKSAADIAPWKQFQKEVGRVADSVMVTVPCQSDEAAERVNELIRSLPSVRRLKVHTPHFAKPDEVLSAAEGRHTAIILRDLPVTEVDLWGEQQNTEAAAAVARVPNLTSFSVPAMTLTTEELRAIVAKDSLRTIYLGGNSVTAEALELLVSAEHLESLGLINPPTENIHLLAKRSGLPIRIQFRTATDDDLRAIARLPNLKQLYLWNCPVTDEGVAALAAATSLEYLQLQYLSITDRSLESLAELPHLTELNCVGSDVTEDGVIAWAKRGSKVPLHVNYDLDRAKIGREVSGARLIFDRPQAGNLQAKAAREAKDRAAITPVPSPKTDSP